MELGIVGLPNVGKSTVFNALTENKARAENYPFCTVDPNVGVVPVPDARLGVLEQKVDSDKTTPASVRFVDVAGLVQNAHQGEGLGNQFLGQIRNVDALCHVLRIFDDSNVSHVEGDVDPRRDLEIIETEFALADLEILEKKIEKLEKKARVGDKQVEKELGFLRELKQQLEAGWRINTDSFSAVEHDFLKGSPLLSTKPVLYVLNVDESILTGASSSSRYEEIVSYIENETNFEYVTICGALEAEMAGMDSEEKLMFLDGMGLEETGLNRLIKKAHRLLDLVVFFTYNGNKLRAWSIKRGSTAPRAAGKVHTDLEKGFIRAETINFEQFKNYGSWQEAREAGEVRSEGKDYVIQDGDIILVKFNV